jgi:phage shock protein PspC (stress-responsive transcriptional regulator)
MFKTAFLLPRNFRFVGIFFFIAGVIAGIARFYFGFKPKFLTIDFFALYSYYINEKFMQSVRNNFGEEITGFLIVTGLFMIAFAREKVENEQIGLIRLKAFFYSFYLNFIFLLLALLFTFGFAFIYLLMFNMVFGLVAYIVSFKIMLFMHYRKTLKSTDNNND